MQRRRVQIRLFVFAETDAETRTNSKKPAVHGTNARITRGVRYLKTGWWRRSGPNWLPPTQGSNQVSETRVRDGIFCCRDRAAKWAHSPRLQEQRPPGLYLWLHPPVGRS